MTSRTLIIQGIISSGGLYGQIAERIAENDRDKFIIECFEQCHNKEAHELWGQELVMDIISYRLDLIRIPFKELLEQEKYETMNLKKAKKP